MKRLILPLSVMAALLLLFSFGMPRSMAQTTATATPAAQPTVATPGSEVEGLLTVCADSVIINFTGSVIAGNDIFFQIFSGTAGSGTALSSLRQAQVDGTFTFTERVPFAAGTTVAAGQSASAQVSVARESNSDSVEFSFTLTDAQDGCGTVTATNTSVDVAGGTTAGTTPGTTTTAARHILAPNGGVLNPNLTAEPLVVIGARQSDNFRSQTPGLIFAECNAFPMALPGIIFDTDQITVYWSWFTRTEEQMQQHLEQSNYSVKLNQAPFPNVVRSDIERRDGNYWVFYSASVGNLAPGNYEVEYRLTWNQPVNDGYDDYGPGTDNPIQANNCAFQVARNSNNTTSIAYSGMYLPMAVPAHYVEPEY